MKTLISVAVLLVSTGAFADSLIPAQAELSASCQKKIVSATFKACNSDSKVAEGEDRMHPCIGGEETIINNHSQRVELSAFFTAGDADDYNYTVDVTDKASCEFTVESSN